jgi:hypothetical protein
MEDVPENIVLRLALGSGPTTDGDVSSNVWAWVRSDPGDGVHRSLETGSLCLPIVCSYTSGVQSPG